MEEESDQKNEEHAKPERGEEVGMVEVVEMQATRVAPLVYFRVGEAVQTGTSLLISSLSKRARWLESEEQGSGEGVVVRGVIFDTECLVGYRRCMSE